MTPDFPDMKRIELGQLPASLSELRQWLIECGGKYAGGACYLVMSSPGWVTVEWFTEKHVYHVSVVMKDGEPTGMLGSFRTRAMRPGEEWNRGNDLTDGEYSRETWNRILADAMSNEMVRVEPMRKTQGSYSIKLGAYRSADGVESGLSSPPAARAE